MASIEVVKHLLSKISEGSEIEANTKALAVLDISPTIAKELKIVDELTPLRGSTLLNGAIHEILKKLEGKKERAVNGEEPMKIKRRSSSKKTLKAKRMFEKKEPKKKDSAIWRKLKRTAQ
uniref:Uncharacterized protein n=1 Tax=Caenorhabditis japonica TaxID=281687 RepID=A0A8R1DLC6_CAEJA